MPLTGNIKVSPTKHIIGVNNIVIYSTTQEKIPAKLRNQTNRRGNDLITKNKGVLHTPLI